MKTPRGIYLGGAVHAVFVYSLAVVWLCHAVVGQMLSGCTGTDCVAGLQNCGVTITVDSQAGQNCSRTMLASMSLSGRVCNGLQDVLNSIGSNVTTHPPGDCISVNLAAGDYVITNAVTIAQNVVIRGEFGPLTIESTTDICPATTESNPTPQPGGANGVRQVTQPPPPADPSDCTSDATFADLFQVRVTFDLQKPVTSDLQDPCYAVVFTGSDAVAVRGIMFSNGPGILGFEDISFVSVENCSFSYFLEGAVDAHNCGTVEVSFCSFAHNGPANVLKNQMYRGHSPGLSIAYNYASDSTVAPVAIVTKSVFYNNTAGTDVDVFTTTQLLQQLLFPGRGGGLTIIVNSLVSSNVLVEDCLMQENTAVNYGGGMYTLLDGLSNHVITVNRSRFIRNTTPGTSGGLHMGFCEEGTNEFTNSLFLYDTVFRGNEAMFGGGVFFLHLGRHDTDGQLGNSAELENCEFTDNVAGDFSAAFGAISAVPFVSRENTRPLRIINCTFIRNTVGEAGVVGTAYFPIAFFGNNLFEENRGSSLVILGAVVKVFGHITFFNNNNNGIDGGALYVTSLGQILLHPGAGMTFNNNSGGLGAAIVAETPEKIPSVFSSLLYNPLCTLLFNNTTLSPLLWHESDVTLSFLGNRAIVGSAVYLNNLRLCSWTQLAPPFFSDEGVFRWEFVQFSENENDAFPDQFNELWYVQTPAKELNISNFVTGYPGQKLELGITALDELNQETAVVVRLSDQSTVNFMSESSLVEFYRFVPSAITYDRIQSGTLNTSFVQRDVTDGRPENILVESVIPDQQAGTMTSFQVTTIGCPPGYILAPASVSDYYTCDCDFDNPDIVNCDNRDIILDENLWATAGRGDPLLVYPCPFGYCRCFLGVNAAPPGSCAYVATSMKFNDQCACGRQGILCSECQEGKGVSALTNSCVSCHDASGILILGLIVADALVILGLLTLFLKLPFPSVLYPCVFYLQILPYLTEYFPATFDKFRPYLYYISSATGFYFPYDFCLYHSMSPLVSYTIRYFPFLLTLIIAPIVLIIRRYKFLPVPWHGLWWTVLLLYTPLLHTSMSLLNCPSLSGISADRAPRWFIDANIKCFAYGGHAPLGLLAIAVLLVCVLLIPTAVLFSLGKIQNPRWPHHLVDPLTWGFKKKFAWWTAVEMGRRIILVLFIVAFPNNDYPAIFIICLFLAVFGLLQPYKSLFTNILEMVLSADVLIMLLFRNTEHLQEVFQVLPRQTLSRSCDSDNEIKSVTTMSWILAIFYYLPLLVTLGMVVLWVVKSVRVWWKDEKQQQSHSGARDESIGHIAKPPMTTVIDIAELDTTMSITQANTENVRCFTTSIVTFEELDGIPGGEGEACQKGHSHKHRGVQKIKSAPPVVTRTQTESEDKVGDEES